MKKSIINIHSASIIIYFLTSILIFFYLIFLGYDYYSLPLEERFFSTKHIYLKPSGKIGHLLGIIGSILITFGVLIYVIRKRYKKFHRFGYLKYWLEFHIFLCATGTVLIIFHTSFKFGGIISIGFWSLIIVFISGIIGRVIYIQIPRTIQGEMLSINDLKNQIEDAIFLTDSETKNLIIQLIDLKELKIDYPKVESDFFNNLKFIFYQQFENRLLIKKIYKEVFNLKSFDKNEKKIIINKLKQILSLKKKIIIYYSIEKLFKQWHIFHLPFAITMFVLMFIHIIVTLLFIVSS